VRGLTVLRRRTDTVEAPLPVHSPPVSPLTHPTLKVLLVEDSPDDAVLVLRAIEKAGYIVSHTRVETEAGMAAALDAGPWDIIVSDHRLPQFSSFAALSLLQQRQLDLPFIIASGTIGEEVAVAAMKAGAHDYVMKGNLARLGPAIARELKEARTRAEGRRASAALTRSEAHFRSLIEHSSDMICVLDAEGRFRYISPSVTRVLGYEPATLHGTCAFDLVSLADVPGVLREFDAVFHGQIEHGTGEYRFLHADNSWRILESIGQRLVDPPDGEPAIIVNSRDVTLRKASEEALQQTEARLRLLNAISLHVKLGMTLDDVVAFAVTEIAAHFPQYRVAYGTLDERGGLSVRYGLGTPALPFVAGRTADLAASVEGLELLGRGEPLIVEHVARDDRLGTFGALLREWNVNAVLLMSLRVGGRLRGVLSLASPEARTWRPHEITTLREVTDYLELAAAETEAQEDRRRAEAALKLSEKQLRQAQKMEAIGRLAGGIAHDFNNLLTAILGYSELLLAEVREGNPIRRDILEIKQAGDRAAALTRQLLAFSRQQVLEPQILDLNAVVANMQHLLRRLIGEDVDLITYPESRLGRIKADPGQLEQVVMNLALNARDAMPAGGRLTIGTANVELAGDDALAAGAPPGSYVRLSVSDTGTGMDAETQSRAFEPFFTTKDASKGTGLGLATVYGIVQQSHGFLLLTSEVGRGTTFRIYFPAVDAPSTAEPRPAPLAPVHESGVETILIAEDETAIRNILRTVLRRAGYRLIEAANGDEALESLREHGGCIDLLISDVVMPGLSGPDLAERVRAVQPNVRVLYLSGYSDVPIDDRLATEATAFLPKPFTPAALTEKVRQVLNMPAQP
jgi:two-component system cell cycle sensor histidine kinase/response regulator CckA